VQAVAQLPVVFNSAALESEREKSIAIQDPFVEPLDAAELNIVPNGDWQDRALSEQARDLWQRGELFKAEALLLGSLEQVSDAPLSLSLLLELYSQQHNLEAYSRMLQYLNILSLDKQYYFKAKLALMREDTEAAINLLEEKLDLANENESYCALLAGLYQQAGRHHDSAVSYRRLLDVFGDKSSYWLGLALSLDALSQHLESLQAFKRLGHYADLQPPVRRYIEQRIQQLESY
jgi:MSHA biogenesis protein MshN